jgi:hypothetical protein
MRKFQQEEGGARAFYLCAGCGNRVVFLPRLNGLSEGWPREVFNEAVAAGILTERGRVVG